MDRRIISAGVFSERDYRYQGMSNEAKNSLSTRLNNSDEIKTRINVSGENIVSEQININGSGSVPMREKEYFGVKTLSMDIVQRAASVMGVRTDTGGVRVSIRNYKKIDVKYERLKILGRKTRVIRKKRGK